MRYAVSCVCKKLLVIRIFKFIFGCVATIAALLFLLLMLMRLDGVKHRLALFVSTEMTGKYGVPLEVKEVEVRGFNDLRLNDVTLYGLEGDTIVRAAQARVYLQTRRLLDGEVRINTLVFDSPDIRLSRKNPLSELNVQYLVDILKGDKEKEKSKIDLRINQLLAYDGHFSYDVLSEDADCSGLDVNHVDVADFACNISLKRLSDDELDLHIRSVSGREKCGLDIERLRARVQKDGYNLFLNDLEFRTPHSNIAAKQIELCADSTWNNIVLKGGVKSGCLALDELAPFVNIPPMEFSSLSFSAEGYYRKDTVGLVLSANAIDKSFVSKVRLNVVEPFAAQKHGRLTIDEFYADDKITSTVLSLARLDTLDYDIASRLGNLSLNGDVVFDKDSVAGEVNIGCSSGIVAVNGSLASNGIYALSIKGKNFDLPALTGIEQLACGEMELETTGNMNPGEFYAQAEGRVFDLAYNDYVYAPVDFKGRYAADDITVRMKTDDPNVKMKFAANYSVDDARMLQLKLKTDKFVPSALNLYDTEGEQEFSFGLNCEYLDYGEGKTVVNAKVDNLSLVNDADTLFVRNFYVCDNKAGDDRMFVVTSDFVSASIFGDFDFKSIFKSLTETLKAQLPVLEISTPDDDAPLLTNDFYYDVAVTNSTPLTRILNLPVTVLEPSRVKGVFNEHEKIFTIDASVNKIDFYGSLIRSFNITGKSDNKGLYANAQFYKPMVKKGKAFDYDNLEEDIVVRLNANIASDKIIGLVNWNNFKSDDVMNGMVRMDAALSRNSDHELEIAAKIHKDSVTHKNQIWYINEGTVAGKIDRMIVENVGLSSHGQELKIEGVIGKEQSDSLNAYLRNVDVSTVFDFIKFRILQFGGRASGQAHLTGLLSAPNAGGLLDVRNFSIDGAVLGTGKVFVGWEDESKSIILDAAIRNEDNDLTTVNGFLSQANDTISLMIDADNINAAFMDRKLGAFLTGTNGYASGKVHLHGQWRSVDLEGAVALNQCSSNVKANNTWYNFSGDTLRFSKGCISFDNVSLYDRNGNKGSISGFLTHRNLGRWACEINIKTDNMLVYNTADFGTLPFYGTVFATGDALIKSDASGFLLKANMKTTPGSRFVYNSNVTSGARDNSFVTFTDDTKRKKKESVIEQPSVAKDAYSKTASKLTLDFMLDVNDALELKVYTNLQNDDYISLYGNGPINAVYNDKTGFSMKGHMDLARGSYKFTIQDIFPKVFEISKGSTLDFNGDPYNAELNLKTKYHIPSASLSDLTTEIAKRKTVKVDCVMDITGSLASPDLAFDLELPEGSEEERELLASVASTPEQKNMQFVYLLGVGKFYTFDAIAAQASETNTSTTAVESLISNTISGQLNNMLGKIINNRNWDISGNISTSERGWNSMEVEGMLRGRLLDNRLQINGNLGYRENPITDRNFIGDFELSWLMSPNYNWNIKAYSKTNDRYFSKTDLTIQGIGTSILFEFDRWKWWGKKKDKKNKVVKPGEAGGATDDENAIAEE